jgi:outer membrane protein insertion porin family
MQKLFTFFPKVTSVSLVVFFAAFLCIHPNASAQQMDSLSVVDYGTPKDFEIGGVKVIGAKYSDPNAIASISGLKVGAKVRLPGPEVPRAIKALMNLRLFTNIKIIKEKTIGDVVFLEIQVQERPRLSVYNYTGVPKSQHEKLNDIVNQHVAKGGIVTENVKVNAAKGIEKYFIKKGLLDAKVYVTEIRDSSRINSVKLNFNVSVGKKVKIKDIDIVGNTHVEDKKLLKKMSKTKEKKRLLAGSKFVQDLYDKDKLEIVKYFNTVGYRDARVLGDSLWRDSDGLLHIAIKVNEGNQYYFRNISWKGNSIYDAKTLDQVLGIKKGEIYNQELLDNRLRFSQEGRDVSTLYMDNGYLFFNVDPTEVAIVGDSIDLELRIYEGPQATIDKVVIKGNERTNEHVIRRELRTLPGEKFSRTDIIRSQRQIVNLGYFNPEKFGINTPVNPERGTVDIEYTVEEKPSDQLELSAGWGGINRVIGTLGVSFNNFSVRNMLNKGAWRPLPMGDGQRLSLRAQSNGYFQNYSTSFTEPWLGGRKPNSFSLSGFYNRIGYSPNVYGASVANQRFNIINVSANLGRRLKWPDDNFVSSTSLNYQVLSLNNWPGVFRLENGSTVSQGRFVNFNIKQVIARSTVNEPTYPREGSNISLTMQVTPPYSLLFNRGKDYSESTPQEKFKFLEYYKFRFDADWYTTITGKLVLKTSAKIGVLGAFNSNIGVVPFERYQVGGAGINNQQVGFQGFDIISSRGYQTTDLAPNGVLSNGQTSPAPIFSKFTMELRYPLSLNPSSTIYMHTFVQGINAWSKIGDWNPFELKRSAGFGFRVFLPMFGILGFDWAYGFDKPGVTTFKGYSAFNIVLGFEPD